MKFHLAFIALAFSFTVASAQDKPVPSSAPQLLSEISLDLDGDGISDRVALVLTGASGTVEKQDDGSYWLKDGELVDLYFYMNNGDKKLDLSAPATFVKKDVLEMTDADLTGLLKVVFPLEHRGKAAVAVHHCQGCGASITWNETLTIASRNHQFLVSGFSRDWDENIHTGNDGDVETTMGQCDINFLTGKGLAAAVDDINQLKALKEKFHPVKLADWSYKKFPKACRG